MNNQVKTNTELIEKISCLNQRIRELELSDSDRKQAEEVPRKSEEKYRSLVENISDVIFDVDHQGMVLYFSPIGKDIWGYNQEDVIGKNFIELVHPDDRDLLLQRFLELSGGVEKPLNYRFKDKTGNFRWVRTSTKPRIENGIFVGASGTLIDITKQKEMETDRVDRYGQPLTLLLLDLDNFKVI